MRHPSLSAVIPGRARGRHARPTPTPRVRPYAPRVPYTPAPEPYEVPPQTASPVRPYVRDPDHRARRHTDHSEAQRARADRDQRGVAALVDIAETTAMWQCPAPGCHMSAPRPMAHPCPLRGSAPETPEAVMA